MHDSFSINLYGALEIADALFSEPSMATNESGSTHSDVLREALRPLELLHPNAVEPNGVAYRTCLWIRELRQKNFD